MNPGLLYAALAFVCWGLLPLYFHAIKTVPPLEILAHRMVWSLLFLLAVLGLRRQWGWLPQLLRQPRVLAGFGASALLLAANWFTYIWCINNGHVIDASLGYFITPLINVTIGYVVLHERLRPLQGLALVLATAGVVWLAWQAGHVPWLSLLLAGTFATYGSLRKTAALGALEGLLIETLLLFPLALGYVLWLTVHGQNTFLDGATAGTRWLLVLAGPITAIPLLMFAAGARRLPLSALGFLQYISPILQLAMGVSFFHEHFSAERLAGFAVIWTALVLFGLEGLWRARRTAAARPAPAR